MVDRVSDLTVEQFRELIRETVLETLQEFTLSEEEEDELEFKPQIQEYLLTYLKDKSSIKTRSLDVLFEEMGLDD